MRILKLHYPTGHPYWQSDEYLIELPDGSFYNKHQHSKHIPDWAKNDLTYCNRHRIKINPDGIYYQECGASSGSGKTNYGDPFKIIDSKEYDKIEFIGKPLIMCAELIAEIIEEGQGDTLNN